MYLYYIIFYTYMLVYTYLEEICSHCSLLLHNSQHAGTDSVHVFIDHITASLC